MADESKTTLTQRRESDMCDYCGIDFEKRHSKGHTAPVHEGRKPTVRPPSNQTNIFYIFGHFFGPIFNSLNKLSMDL